MNIPKINSRTKGFTIIETLVATMILTMTILGPLTVAINSATYARQVKDIVTATYLAQEAIELLRHQQSSVYIRCSQPSSSGCTINTGESSRDAAWRILKQRLSNNASGPTCFSTTCAYDFIDMTTNEDNNPTKYNTTGSSCSTLSINSSGMYVCTGAHAGAGSMPTGFTRQVSIQSINTFNDIDAQYNDDLRVTVTVSYIRANGTTRQIKVVDFLHSRG